MTLARAIEKARRFSRTQISGCSNLEAMRHVNEAQKDFVKKVRSLTKEGYVTITPRFDIETDLAIRLTVTGGANALAVTDIVITAADALDQTGTQVATALQTAIQAAITSAGGTPSLTVAWSTTTWKFTIDAIDATAVVLDNPTTIIYASALELLGLEAETTADHTVTGNIPTDCTMESALPTDFLSMATEPEWDGEPLINTPMEYFKSPASMGNPTRYYVRNKRIMLYPAPDHQDMLHIWYKFIPADFVTPSGYQECGLTGKTSTSLTGLVATTTYYLKIAIDGGAITEYSITTAALLTYVDVIDLLNAATLGVTWSLVDGDLRCTSNTMTATSAVSLTAGTTGTDFFATLTGFSAVETAIASDGGDELEIDDEYAMAVAYKAASQMAEENNETTVRDGCYAQFSRICQDFIIHRANNNTAVLPEGPQGRPDPRVDFGN